MFFFLCLSTVVHKPKTKQNRGKSRIYGKGVKMYRGVWGRFVDFISFFLNYPMK